MRTDKQNEASRRNGGKSQGPVTPQGKANSAQNAVRHNLCTGHLVLLSNEDPREFHQLMNDYIRRFQPIDGVELDLVHKMIAATWREKRTTAMESSLFELEMDRQQPDIDDEFEEISAAGRQTLALFGTDDTKTAAALLLRYGAAVRRAYTSAFRVLRDLQGDRFNRTPAAVSDLPHIVQESPSTPATDSGQPQAVEPQAVSNTTPIVVLRRRTQIGLLGAQEASTILENNELPNEPRPAIANAHSLSSSLVAVAVAAA